MRRNVHQLKFVSSDINQEKVAVGITVIAGINHPSPVRTDRTQIETLAVFIENFTRVVSGAVAVHVESRTVTLVTEYIKALPVGGPAGKTCFMTFPWG